MRVLIAVRMGRHQILGRLRWATGLATVGISLAEGRNTCVHAMRLDRGLWLLLLGHRWLADVPERWRPASKQSLRSSANSPLALKLPQCHLEALEGMFSEDGATYSFSPKANF